MPKQTVSVTINRPIQDVFDFVAVNYFKNYQKWAPEIVELHQLTDGPVRAGTAGRWRRIGARGTVDSTFKVSDFEPNRKFGVATTDTPRISSFYEFTPTGEGTQLSLTMARDAKGLRGVLGPILGGGQERERRVLQYAERIKSLLESAS